MTILLKGNRILHILKAYIVKIQTNTLYRIILGCIVITALLLSFTFVYYETKKECLGNFCGEIVHSPLLINDPFELSRLGQENKETLAYLSHEVLFDGVMVQMYEPLYGKLSEAGLRPATVFIHGGGWLNKEHVIRLEQPLIREMLTHSVIFSIDYSSAADSPFPAAFDECFRATRYLLKQYEDYRLDPNKIIIVGGSSGGNIAAAVSMAVRDDENLLNLRAQVLLNPPLQALDFNTPSYMQNDSLSGLARGDMINFWSFYARGEWDTSSIMKSNRHLPKLVREEYSEILDHKLIPDEYMVTSINYEKAKENEGPEEPSPEEQQLWDSIRDTYLNPYFAPLMANSFSGLPETLIYAGFHDILRDDGIFYGHQLQLAGVPCSMYVDPQGFHGAFWYRAGEVGLVEELIRIYDR